MSSNTNPAELACFDEHADQWWDNNGAFRGLHDINPVRLRWIERFCGTFKKKRIADIGCGGGLLAEAMAKCGAEVTGIDLSEKSLAVAEQHARESGLTVSYRKVSVEAFASENTEAFDVVTCLELLEHVCDPHSVISACARLTKPGGQVFFSSLNRTPMAYLLAILSAERLFGIIPKGTHHYEKFIRPSELNDWAIESGLVPSGITGIGYEAISRKCWLRQNTSVNYLLRAVKC